MSTDISKFDWVDAEPGVRRKIISCGERLMQMIVELKAGSVTNSHRHVHEQVAYIVKGKIKFTVDGQDIIVPAGQALVLPSNCFHGAAALEESIILDTFNPPREDLLSADSKRVSY